MSLYLQYRPRKINDLDLTEVRDQLSRIIKSGKIAHAYLFTGPRGAGKTSSARILASAVNCEKRKDSEGEPCGVCGACLSITQGTAVDLVEIDAASNRGIDDIRDLKAKIRLAPTTLRQKVYIIDEVHMLTTEAFNALLKVLEEPPEHAMFILCTTEAHKVPETIRSRCVTVSYRKATTEEMLRSLRRVTKGESIAIEEAALELLAGAVDGSFRDGVKMLEQLTTLSREVKRGDVEQLLYGVSNYDPRQFLKPLLLRNTEGALQALWEAEARGVEYSYLLKTSMALAREVLLSRFGLADAPDNIQTNEPIASLIRLMDETVRKLQGAVMPRLLIELMVIEWCSSSGRSGPSGGEGDGGKKESAVIPPKESSGLTEEVLEKEVQEQEAAAISSLEPLQTGIAVDGESLKHRWQELLKVVSGQHYSLEALLSKARPVRVSGDELTVEVYYKFHKEQLEADRLRTKLETMLSEVFSSPMHVRVEVGHGMPKAEAKILDSLNEVKPDGTITSGGNEDDLVEAAKEIFTQ